ncbi:hypothetical protein HPT27_05955 [Permianibacter sp. IMCC34836]|uniref:hypothetical protein n=1 Tax=Permianibacter fluminis TaxID=2738515 RepID=UPI001557530E|nr:hypothetical protein [Permianibacter fluminis]NQD36561.1 hypothetical protein [Permianibacter fluminis]
MRTGQLGLSVRERGATRQTQVTLTARAVSQWLDSLPIANIGESARQVYQFLVDVNSASLDVGERLKIMQALTKVVGHITDALRKHYIGQSVSLNEKQRKIAALAQAMQSEMAIGYKTVVEDMLGEGHQRYNPQVLVPALYYATHYLSLVLLRCYQLYSQQPARLWKELHSLFHFAEQNGLHRTTAVSEYSELTVESAYLRIVLTACANPYQLRQREIEQLFDAAATLSAEALLQPYAGGKDLFFLDLESDLGPQSSALNQQTPGPNCRSVQLDAVLARVQDDLRSASGLSLGVAKNPVQQLGATLLRHLVRAYGNLASRAFSRTPANGTIRVAVGLSASHYLLAGEGDNKAETGQNDRHDLNTLEGSLHNATLVDDDRLHSRMLAGNKKVGSGPTDPWEKLYRTKESPEAGHKAQDLSATAPRNFTNNANVSYEFQIAALINISPGGYCLGLRGNVPVQTQTGEVVGLMEQDEDGALHWNIGSIRWMKRIPDGALHLGIQLIAPNARPVLTQVRNSQQAGSAAFQRSLLLPALKGIGQPATLITAPMPYAVKQKVRIKDGSKVYDVQLTKQVAASASYRQFHFNDALNARDSESSGNKAGDGDSFDSVWELL